MRAPRSKPSPALEATRSPSAVPSVLGHQDRQPIEDLFLFRGYVFELDSSRHAPPYEQDGQYAAKERDRRLDVAKPNGPIEIVRHRGTDGRGGDYHRPISEGAIAPGRHLYDKRDGEERHINQAGDCIPEIQRHGECVTAGLPQGRRKKLDEPERKGDMGYFTDQFAWMTRIRVLLCHCVATIQGSAGPTGALRPALPCLLPRIFRASSRRICARVMGRRKKREMSIVGIGRCADNQV